MNAELLAVILGVVLSLAFNYVPGLAEKYAGLAKEQKSLIMLGLLLVASAGAYGLACAGWAADFGLQVTCDRKGLVEVIQAFVAAVIANQAAYSISPQTQKVLAVKAERS